MTLSMHRRIFFNVSAGFCLQKQKCSLDEKEEKKQMRENCSYLCLWMNENLCSYFSIHSHRKIKDSFLLISNERKYINNNT